MRIRSLALAAAAICAAAPAFAGSITVYEDSDFGGKSTTITRSMSNLDGTGWNDIISSIVVNSGEWEICKESGFRNCRAVEGRDMRNLKSNGMNDSISSIREVTGGGFGGGDDSCRWANNGRCDETGRGDYYACAKGTDSSDCRGGRPGSGGALGGLFPQDDDNFTLRYDESKAEQMCEYMAVGMGFADPDGVQTRNSRRQGNQYRVEWSDGYRRGSCRVDGNTLRTQVDGTRR